MASGEPIPPELSSFLKQARSGAPEPDTAIRERVRVRVEASIAGKPPGGDGTPPQGASGGTVPGTIVKGGLALLLVLGGGYAALRGSGGSAPQAPVASAVVGSQLDGAEVPSELEPSMLPETRVAPPEEPAVAPASIEVAAPSKPSEPREKQRRRPRPRAEEEAPAPDLLAEEEALLEKARALLRANPTQALPHLREHLRRFPEGQLGEERELLRVRASTAKGDLVEARSLAKRFMETYPDSASRREMEKIWEKH